MAVHRVRTGGIAAELEVTADGSVRCVCGADDVRFDIRPGEKLLWIEQVSHDTIKFNFFPPGAEGGALPVQTSVKSKNCLSIMDDIMGVCTPSAAAPGGRRSRRRRKAEPADAGRPAE